MLKHIVLHLARGRDFPSGSAAHGYDLIAPLDDTGRLDVTGWRKARDRCRVRRFWGEEPELVGRLVRKAGGAGGASWRFDYDEATDSDDETGYRLGSHVFNTDDYVSIADAEGAMHTFRVVAVHPA